MLLAKDAMKILVVCSGNKGIISPFIKEQVESIRKQGCEVEYYLIEGKGLFGYIRSILPFRRRVLTYQPTIIHAHYGLSGLFACFQRRVPVIVTLHGSDVSILWVRFVSQLSIWLSASTILVSKKMKTHLLIRKYDIIPCGVDSSLFIPLDRITCRNKLDLPLEGNLILFSSSFDNGIKNYPLALNALNILLEEFNATVIELKGYNREQVVLLMNAVNVCLMTSFSEGSPQFIKEAMSCNTPIVSVDVGDVKDAIDSIEGCYLTTYNAKDIAHKLNLAIDYSLKNDKTSSRDRLNQIGLDINSITQRLLIVYNRVLYMWVQNSKDEKLG